MTEQLNELIKTAPIKKKGDFQRLMFIPDGKYDGFWGKNGYENMIVFGQDASDEKWYRITSRNCRVDVFQTFFNSPAMSHITSVDIPSEFKVPNLFFNKPIHINFEIEISAVIGHVD